MNYNTSIMKKAIKIVASVVAVIVIIAMVGGGYIFQQIKQIAINGGYIVEWNTTDGEIIKDLTYGESYRNTYDLYLPANKTPQALMLFIHGGAWTQGDKGDMAWAAMRYAKDGYVTASINYSRIDADSILVQGGVVRPSIQSMLREIEMSITAIKGKCKMLGCDIRQMAIGGYSAGAHLAMLYSTHCAESSPIPIKFQISWVGPSDFNLLFPSAPRHTDAVASDERAKSFYADMERFAYGLSGKQLMAAELTEEVFHSLKSDVSPAEYVTPHTPPAILAYGGKDMLVNAMHGQKMAQTLAEQGVAHKLFVFPNSGHELGHDADYTDSVQMAISEYCEKYFSAE